jgi:DNA-binding PadR family transcriptional regulator
MVVNGMREPSFLVLTALADGRHHGYAVMKAVEDLSDGTVRLRPGSLYATLDRLAESGLIRDAGEEVVEGRPRRYYELTSLGADRLAEEIERLRSNAARAEKALQRRRTLGVTA